MWVTTGPFSLLQCLQGRGHPATPWNLGLGAVCSLLPAVPKNHQPQLSVLNSYPVCQVKREGMQKTQLFFF